MRGKLDPLRLEVQHAHCAERCCEASHRRIDDQKSPGFNFARLESFCLRGSFRFLDTQSSPPVLLPDAEEESLLARVGCFSAMYIGNCSPRRSARKASGSASPALLLDVRACHSSKRRVKSPVRFRSVPARHWVWERAFADRFARSGPAGPDEPHVSATNVTSRRLNALLRSRFRPAASCARC